MPDAKTDARLAEDLRRERCPSLEDHPKRFGANELDYGDRATIGIAVRRAGKTFMESLSDGNLGIYLGVIRLLPSLKRSRSRKNFRNASRKAWIVGVFGAEESFASTEVYWSEAAMKAEWVLD